MKITNNATHITTLTLDTNLLQEYWKQQKKEQFVERLIDLAQQGKVDLAVTARVREDIPVRILLDTIHDLDTFMNPRTDHTGTVR